jgi:hypothetical protein
VIDRIIDLSVRNKFLALRLVGAAALAIVKGQLDVRSERGAGIALELRVLGRTAYLARRASSSV